MHGVLAKGDSYEFPLFEGNSVLKAKLETGPNSAHREVSYYRPNVLFSSKPGYYALTYDGKHTEIYSDGKIVKKHGFATPARIHSSTKHLRIGGLFGTGTITDIFGGVVYSLRISRNIRNCIEIQEGNCVGKYFYQIFPPKYYWRYIYINTYQRRIQDFRLEGRYI